MEGWIEKQKDFEEKKKSSASMSHKKVCSILDKLDLHPKKDNILFPDDKPDKNKENNDQSFPGVSVLFAESANKAELVFSKAKQKKSKKDNHRSDKSQKKSNKQSKKTTVNKKAKKGISFQNRFFTKSNTKTKKDEKRDRTKKKSKNEKKHFPKKRKKKIKLIIGKGKKKSKEKKKITIASETSQKEHPVKTLSQDQIDQLRKEALTKDPFIDPTAWEEIDFYELRAPFVYISVMKNSDTKERRYLVLEQQLSEDEKKHYHFILDALQTYSIKAADIKGEDSETILQKEVDEIINDYGLSFSARSKDKIRYVIEKNLLGFGKINPLMNDPHIEDISCDGANLPIFLYHRDHGSIQSNVQFDDEDELSGFVMRLAQKCGKHISIAHPMIDATMPDGSRIQMTLSTEVSTKGSTFTIRKFREQPFSPADLIKFNSFSSEMIAYFWLAVEHGVNGLIAGGTAAGKTSTLNALALFVPRESKIVSIEETREINLPHPNWIPGVSRSGFGDVVAGKMTGEIDLYDLMKAALRQRPEYIVVGEIRGREAYVLFQAMATGHTTYSTVHADSTKSLIHRLEGEPINIPRIMLQSLDVVCLQTITRVKNKRARRCKQVIEIIDIDPTTKEILTNEVFRWNPVEDSFKYTGKSYVLEQIRMETNQSREEITAELRNRAVVLDWMVKHNIHLFDEVASLIAQYYEHPDEMLKKVKGDS